jgi:hypothetical protein
MRSFFGAERGASVKTPGYDPGALPMLLCIAAVVIARASAEAVTSITSDVATATYRSAYLVIDFLYSLMRLDLRLVFDIHRDPI